MDVKEEDYVELVAELSTAILEDIYYNRVFAPRVLWVHGETDTRFSEEAQDHFNTISNTVDQTLASFLLDKDMEESDEPDYPDPSQRYEDLHREHREYEMDYDKYLGDL